MMKIRECFYSPGDIIYLNNEIALGKDDTPIYLLKEGSVNIYYDATDPITKKPVRRIIETLRAPSVFGMESFFTGT